MADRIISVQYLTASSSGVEIDIPKLWEDNNLANGSINYNGATWWPNDKIKYVFNDFHSGNIELTQDQGDVAGIPVVADTIYESDEYRLKAQPPRFLYSSKASGEPCRVTVILIR